MPQVVPITLNFPSSFPGIHISTVPLLLPIMRGRRVEGLVYEQWIWWKSWWGHHRGFSYLVRHLHQLFTGYLLALPSRLLSYPILRRYVSYFAYISATLKEIGYRTSLTRFNLVYLVSEKKLSERRKVNVANVSRNQGIKPTDILLLQYSLWTDFSPWAPPSVPARDESRQMPCTDEDGGVTEHKGTYPNIKPYQRRGWRKRLLCTPKV